MTRRGHRLLALAAVTIAATALGAVPATGQVLSPSRVAPIDGQGAPGTLPNRIARDVGIVETLGARVPTDAPFVDDAGRTVRLADVLATGRPAALVFVYHSCPMLCSLVLDGVAEAASRLDGLRPGRDYEIVAVSMDPRDTPARAAEAKARYVAQIADALGDSSVAAGMHLWTVTPETEASVRGLADAVGFGYAWDPRTEEYAHHAALMLVSPDGVLTRYLYGIQYPPRDLRLAIVEASDGTVGTTLDRFLLTCYEFDDASRSYSLAVLSLLKWGGGLLLVVFGGAMVLLWRREGHRTRQAAEPTAGARPASRTADPGLS